MPSTAAASQFHNGKKKNLSPFCPPPPPPLLWREAETHEPAQPSRSSAAAAAGRGRVARGRAVRGGRGRGAVKTNLQVPDELPEVDPEAVHVPVAMVATNGVHPVVDIANFFKLSETKVPSMALGKCLLDGVPLNQVNALKKLTARLAILAGVGITVVNTRVNTVMDVEKRKLRIHNCLGLLTDGCSSAKAVQEQVEVVDDDQQN